MFQCIGVLKNKTDGSRQTSAASDPLHRVNVYHETTSWTGNLTKSYQLFTQTTVFYHSRLEHASPFHKRRVPYSDWSTHFSKTESNLKLPLFSHVVAYRGTCSLGRCSPNFFARGHILASKNIHRSPNPCSRRYKYRVFHDFRA